MLFFCPIMKKSFNAIQLSHLGSKLVRYIGGRGAAQRFKFEMA